MPDAPPSLRAPLAVCKPNPVGMDRAGPCLVPCSDRKTKILFLLAAMSAIVAPARAIALQSSLTARLGRVGPTTARVDRGQPYPVIGQASFAVLARIPPGLYGH